MAISTSRSKKVSDRNRSVEFESIEEELKRQRVIDRAAGTRSTFTKGKARRAN